MNIRPISPTATSFARRLSQRAALAMPACSIAPPKMSAQPMATHDDSRAGDHSRMPDFAAGATTRPRRVCRIKGR